MQYLFVIFFALILLVAIIGGIAGLIDPSALRSNQMKENPSRKRIAAISVGLFIASFVGLAISAPEPTPEERAAQAAAAKAKAKQEAADKAKAEQEEKARVALAAKQAADAKAAKAESAKKKAKEKLAEAINAIRIADKVCAESIIEVGKSAKAGGDRYDLYGVAKDAADNCAQSAEDMAKIEVPKDIEEARKLCIEGELTRAIALSQSASIFDAGQGSPATLHSLKEDMSAGQMKVLACMGVLAITARKAGVELGDME